MGGGVSHAQHHHEGHHPHSHYPHPHSHAPHWTADQEFFAFQVFQHDMEHGTLAEERKLHAEDTSASEKLSNEDFYLRVEEIFLQAIQEKDTPLLECKSPAVIAYKYSKLTAEEKEEIQQQVLEAAVLKDKKQFAAAQKAQAQDYSKSFGGTEADSKNEQEAAAILRGESTKATDDVAILQSPNMPHASQHVTLKQLGKWMKYLSKKGCYLYIHPLTRDLLAIKPEEFIDEVDTQQVEGEDAQAEVDPANGLPKIPLTELPAEIDRIVKELKKTPLIIDNSPSEVVRTYYSYKAHLEDVSCLTIPFGKSGLKREDVMERCRKRLVGAMKSGEAFVFFTGGLTIEHADFKTKLCKKVSTSHFALLLTFFIADHCCTRWWRRTSSQKMLLYMLVRSYWNQIMIRSIS